MIHRFDEEALRIEIEGASSGPFLPGMRDAREFVNRCAARHLAVAAFELAHDPRLSPDELVRFALAESRFRALTDLDGTGLARYNAAATPFVRLEDGRAVPVTDLLATACEQAQFRLPHRSIDHDLVHEAKELLCGLRWHLPLELGEEGRAAVSALPRQDAAPC